VVLDPLDEQHLLSHAFFCFDQQRVVVVGVDGLPQPVIDVDEVLFEVETGLASVVLDECCGGTGQAGTTRCTRRRCRC
jgi:hypothetical protein